MKKYLCLFALMIGLGYGCSDLFENNKIDENNVNFEAISVENDVVVLESEQSLRLLVDSYKKDVNGQNEFIEKIKTLQNDGFKPLTPIFNSMSKTAIQEFVVRKKEKVQKRNVMFGLRARDPRDFELDLEDDLIKDPVLSSLLNEERKVIVGDNLYQYTELGLFIVDKDNEQVLIDYLNSKTPEQKRLLLLQYRNTFSATNKPQEINENLGNGLNTFRMANPPISDNPDGDSSSGGGGYTGGGSNDGNLGGVGGTGVGTLGTGGSSSGTGTTFGNGLFDPTSFSSCTIETQGFFEGIFGQSESCIEYYNDNRRVHVTFWNQNFLVFSSVGASTRLQKREHLNLVVGTISWWEKSYATKLALGINNIAFNYNYNVPVFNQAQYNNSTTFFEFNNTKYNINGQAVPSIPASSSNFSLPRNSPENILDITVCGYDLQVSSATAYNAAIDALINKAITTIQDYTVRQQIQSKKDLGILEVRIVNAAPFSNTVQFIIAKKNFTANNDNSIVHYFDFNFLISFSSNSNSVGDYLQGLNGATSYTAVKADFYGSALHNNYWKGRRLIHIQ